MAFKKQGLKNDVGSAIALIAVLLSSCGYSLTKTAGTSTTIAAVTTVSATVTTVDYGESCNNASHSNFIEQFTNYAESWNTTFGVPTNSKLTTAYNRIKSFRFYVRGLELPTLNREQKAAVDMLEKYLQALNRYRESGKRDLDLNDVAIPLWDALGDFSKAYTSLCRSRN